MPFVDPAHLDRSYIESIQDPVEKRAAAIVYTWRRIALARQWERARKLAQEELATGEGS